MNNRSKTRFSSFGSHWRLARWVLLAAWLVLVVFTVKHFHWDDRFYFYLKTHWQASEWRDRGLWLPDYEVVIDAHPIPGIEDNLSSIVYDHDQDRLLALTNRPAELFVLTRTGGVLARYPLTGFGDSEGMSYMGDGLLLITDEDSQRLNVIRIPDEPRTVDISEARWLALGSWLDDNKGFEGVGYDAARDRLFVAKERSPRQLFEVQGIRASLEGDLGLRIINRTDWIKDQVFGTDLSSVDFDAGSGHLVILSDESKLLVELTGEGRFVSYLNLRGGLRRTPPQPEGVALDRDGNLYLVSEPNLFYSFRKP